MPKPYLHKLPSYRHPVTKARAIVGHAHGTRNTVSIDVFPYRSRIGGNVAFLLAPDVKPWLISHGYLAN